MFLGSRGGKIPKMFACYYTETLCAQKNYSIFLLLSYKLLKNTTKYNDIQSKSLTSTFPGHSGKRGSLGTSHWLDVPSLTAGKTENVFLLSIIKRMDTFYKGVCDKLESTHIRKNKQAK